MLDLTILVRAPIEVIASVTDGNANATRASQKYGRFPDRIPSKTGAPVIDETRPGSLMQVPQFVARAPLAGRKPKPFTRM